jgi:preprotein translocase subunit SecG
MEMFESILWVLFIFACLIVSGVILLQEGKGGGLGEAFGGAGQQTFGVKAAGINKFTGWVALAVVVLAVLITLVRGESGVIVDGAAEPPAIPAGMPDAGAPPAGATTGAPGGAPAGEPGGEPGGDGR